jgi:hypothetical protein
MLILFNLKVTEQGNNNILYDIDETSEANLELRKLA